MSASELRRARLRSSLHLEEISVVSVSHSSVDGEVGSMSESVSLDVAAEKLREWRDCERRLAALKSEVHRLSEEFRQALRACGAEIGTVNGVDVITRRATKTFRGSEFAQKRPDLAEQYTRAKVVDFLDVEALRAEHPEVYETFLSEALRPNWKQLDIALALGESGRSSGE